VNLDPESIHCVENWVTVSITPLHPGWRNVYREPDGSFRTNPCPALLLQEFRSRTEYREAGGRRTHRQDDMKSPYDTRVIFADHDHGELNAAIEISDYLGSVGPDEDPAKYASE